MNPILTFTRIPLGEHIFYTDTLHLILQWYSRAQRGGMTCPDVWLQNQSLLHSTTIYLYSCTCCKKSFLIFFSLPHSQDKPSEMLILSSPESDSPFNSNNKLASRKKGLYKGLCELHSDYEVNNVTNPVAESMTTWHSPRIYSVRGS